MSACAKGESEAAAALLAAKATINAVNTVIFRLLSLLLLSLVVILAAVARIKSQRCRALLNADVFFDHRPGTLR